MSEPQPPLISVIIPHLNQEEFLQRCLESLCKQEFDVSRVEIIVVDNGSKKLPTSVLSGFQDIQLEQENTPGPGPARNRGITRSKAPILAFIDADCIAKHSWLKTIASAFDADPGLQIIGGDVRIALQDPIRLSLLEAYESVFAYRQREYITQHGFSGTGNLAMRREVFQDVGPFSGISIAEDRDWGRRATAMGYAILYVPDMVVFHPARANMRELFTKWDRHVAHDYAEQARDLAGKLRWVAKAFALALSPVWELVRIARSDRVHGMRARWQAFRGLVEIRLYRARRMVGAMISGKKNVRSEVWNRNYISGNEE